MKLLRIFLCILLAVVLIATVAYARQTYESWQKLPADDIIGHAWDLGIIIVFMTPVVLLEIEVFHSALYFTSGTKKIKSNMTVFNVAELLLALVMNGAMWLGHPKIHMPEIMWETIMFAAFCFYVGVKIIHAVVWIKRLSRKVFKKQKTPRI